jgi:glutathione S-transferase/GST-like protein
LLTIYYFPSPNGRKVGIALEEMGLDYELILVNILENEQSKPDFVAISPNGRIPALIDGNVSMFESGAILQYLGRKSGLFYAEREAQRTQIDAWLFWQMSGLGPMAGQLSWFIRVSQQPDRDPADSAYPIHRYRKEVRRLYGVLDRQLSSRDFTCGDYSIADMASWPWVHQYHEQMGDIAEFPAVADWYRRIGERPAVRRALELGLP